MSRHKIYQLPQKARLIFLTQKNVQKNLLEAEKVRRTDPTATIIGDSMIKKVFGDKLSRQLNYKHHVVVRSFGGAKTQCMEDYIKPTVKLSPNQIILHCGTNNLPSSEDPETITRSIINIAKNIKANNVKVAI